MTVTDVPVAATTVLEVEPPPASTRRRRRVPLNRILTYVVTVFCLISINFFLPRALPGDPLSTLVGASSTTSSSFSLTEETQAELARYYDLDGSLLGQFGHYLGGLARGDLGVSIRFNAPVSDLLVERLPWSLLLVGTGILVATIVGLLAGIHSGWRRNRRSDRWLLVAFLGIGNLAVFVLGALVLILFAVKLRWFPLAGGQTPFENRGFLGEVLDVGHHLVLPASVLALQFSALQYLVMRAGMVSELGADHLLLGRAKGLRERRLKYRYAARNALLPVVTVVALQLGLSVAVTIFVERVFAYPGLGRLMFDSVTLRDYPTLQGCFLIISLLVVTLNLVTDLLYPKLDPRVRA